MVIVRWRLFTIYGIDSLVETRRNDIPHAEFVSLTLNEVHSSLGIDLGQVGSLLTVSRTEFVAAIKLPVRNMLEDRRKIMKGRKWNIVAVVWYEMYCIFWDEIIIEAYLVYLRWMGDGFNFSSLKSLNAGQCKWFFGPKWHIHSLKVRSRGLGCRFNSVQVWVRVANQ